MEGTERSIEQCEEEIRRLQEENHFLRESATFFGELAERRPEPRPGDRRRQRDRRLWRRDGPDRRTIDRD